MTYDEWKTTNPADNELGDLAGECDCCGKMGYLRRVWPFGFETYACEECREGGPDD